MFFKHEEKNKYVPIFLCFRLLFFCILFIRKKKKKIKINKKNSYDQPIDSDIKRYEEIRKIKTGQGEDYTTGCLLDYEYIKNNYRLIAIDFSRQKGIRC